MSKAKCSICLKIVEDFKYRKGIVKCFDCLKVEGKNPKQQNKPEPFNCAICGELLIWTMGNTRGYFTEVSELGNKYPHVHNCEYLRN